MSFGTPCDSRRGYGYPRTFLKLISFALLDKKKIFSLSRKILVSERIKFANSEYLRIQTILTCTLGRISN